MTQGGNFNSPPPIPQTAILCCDGSVPIVTCPPCKPLSSGESRTSASQTGESRTTTAARICGQCVRDWDPCPPCSDLDCSGSDCDCSGSDCDCTGSDCDCIGSDCDCIGSDCDCIGSDCDPSTAAHNLKIKLTEDGYFIFE